MYLFEYSSDLIHTTFTTYQLSKVFQILIFEKNFDVLFAEIMQRIWMEFRMPFHCVCSWLPYKLQAE